MTQRNYHDNEASALLQGFIILKSPLFKRPIGSYDDALNRADARRDILPPGARGLSR